MRRGVRPQSATSDKARLHHSNYNYIAVSVSLYGGITTGIFTSLGSVCLFVCACECLSFIIRTVAPLCRLPVETSAS